MWVEKFHFRAGGFTVNRAQTERGMGQQLPVAGMIQMMGSVPKKKEEKNPINTKLLEGLSQSSDINICTSKINMKDFAPRIRTFAYNQHSTGGM